MTKREAVRKTARIMAYLGYSREAKQIPLSRVAVACHMTQAMVSHYENGDAFPSLGFFLQYADALGMDPKECFDIPRSDLLKIKDKARMIEEMYDVTVFGSEKANDKAKGQMRLF